MYSLSIAFDMDKNPPAGTMPVPDNYKIVIYVKDAFSKKMR